MRNLLFIKFKTLLADYKILSFSSSFNQKSEADFIIFRVSIQSNNYSRVFVQFTVTMMDHEQF